MQHLHEMSNESLAVLEITKQMLHDLDFHEGPFSNLRYTSMIAILSHPVMDHISLSEDEIYELLCQNRLHRVTSLLPTKEHEEQYKAFVETGKSWWEKNGERHVSPGLKFLKFPNIRKTIQHLVQRISNLGGMDVKAENDSGVRSVHYSLPSPHFAYFFGNLEIRTKYDGDMRFAAGGGRMFEEKIGIRVTDNNVFGAIQYIMLGLEIPAGMKFKAEAEGGTAEVDNFCDIMCAVVSYFK